MEKENHREKQQEHVQTDAQEVKEIDKQTNQELEQAKNEQDNKPENKTDTEKKPKKLRNRKAYSILKIVLVSVLTLMVLVIGIASVVLASIWKGVEIDETQLAMIETTRIYDREEQLVATLFRENRRYIPLSDMPEMLIDAFIAVEDRRYFDHSGIDYRAILRAVYRDILAGGKVEGGSTITQQLVKNVFLTHEKSWDRKIEEIMLSIKLERLYTKEQILEMYLNYIYFGHGAHGVAAAAEHYFNKQVEDLELQEIALLAALPKAPNNYTPLYERNAERSEQRRKLVLYLMAEQGKITEEQRSEAENTPLKLEKKEAIENEALWTYMDMVLNEAQEKYHLTHEELLTGGYQIYTMLDPTAQEAMFDALSVKGSQADAFFPFTGENQIVQGSMVILNHQTGAVIAIMGGRDYVRKGLNRAISDSRQPGSVFKPIVTYATALEAGWEPYDFLIDERLTYPGNYSPRNYDGQYRGRVTMLEAVQMSYNAPAVWLLNEVGIQNGIDTAARLGFHQVERKLGVALGDTQASPLQMASAYGAFGNNGVLVEPFFIDKIVDRNGQIVAQHDIQQQQVVSPQTAWYMTSMLKTVVEEGTGTRAVLANSELAGKTGTTQGDGENGVRDAWFVGYTPEYAAAVWMGFDSYGAGHVMDTSGGNHPAQIYQYVMNHTLADQGMLAFVRPEGVKDATMTWQARLDQLIRDREEQKRQREEEKQRKKEEREQKKEAEREKKQKEKERKAAEREAEKQRKQEEKKRKQEEKKKNRDS